jgi:starch-binding outer membrane protein, SusD/RagB family
LGTVNSQWALSTDLWKNSYKAIARINRTLVALNSEQTKAKIPQATLDVYIGEARFFRAQQYARLITHFGDVVYSDEVISLEDAYSIGRTDKKEVLQKIYEDFDAAAIALPLSYGTTAVQRVTRGAALALKARAAIYMGDYATAANAAKACIDLNKYSLLPDYSSVFLQSTKNSAEMIFGLATSRELKIGNIWNTANIISRNAGGFAAYDPSWDLFFSYLCTDGLTVDKSPLYNPANPWENRDPRCRATIVEYGTEWLGYIYDPNPTALTVLKTSTNTMVKNNDTRAVAAFASFNGLIWKKGVDNTWVNPASNNNDQIIIRYADVLLMYAEAMLELGQLDQAILDATVNKVRARAYKVPVTATSNYPAITMATPNLRTAIRTERRMELAHEALRYMDIVRWKLASKVLKRSIYGNLDPADLKTKVVDKGLWPFPGIPTIDEDGTPDFKAMEATGLITVLSPCAWDDRQYLWPIPTAELQINPNMKQNPGY